MKKIREKINIIDEQILDLLNNRLKEVLKIGELKRKKNEYFYVPHREKEILERLVKKNKGPISNKALGNIFQEIFNLCRSVQKKLKVAYLGPEATFTHLAAVKNFGRSAELIPVKSIKDVFNEVERKRVDYGLVPIENSTEGVVNHTLDMFIDSDLKICAELMLEISHNLLAKNEDLNKIKKVCSHSQPIAQCRNWLEKTLPNVQLVEVASTACAAQLASKRADTAAIASYQAATLYNLKIVARNIGDKTDNLTRFLVIGEKDSPSCGKDKTSVMFSVKDRVGALHDMLIPFQKNGVNLTKIESRPSGKKVWDYIFFVDFNGHIKDAKVQRTLNLLEKQSFLVKVLGSYPRGG